MWPEAIAVVAVVAIAACIQVVSGFGFSLICVPLLALAVGTKEAVVISAFLGLGTSASQALLERAHRDWPTARRMLTGAFVGFPVGLVILDVASPRTLRALLGVAVVISMVLLSRRAPAAPEGRTADLVAGALSGVLNTSIGTNGPPLVMVLSARRLDPAPFRATISTVLATSGVVTLALFAAAGRITTEVGRTVAFALPALGLGLVVGVRLVRPRVDPQRFRGLVLVLLGATATVSIASVFLTGA